MKLPNDESPFQEQLRRDINAPGRCTRVWRQNAGSLLRENDDGTKRRVVGAPKGSTDLTGIVSPEGWRLEIEVKGRRTPDKPHQKKRRAALERLGALVFMFRLGADLEASVAQAIAAVDAAIARRREI